MVILGITGGLATGKTTVAGLFRQFGAKVLDADDIAHDLLQPGRPAFKAVVRHFGGHILHAGRIDRQQLSQRVFRDAQERRVLEGLLHPRVLKYIRRELALIGMRADVPAAVLDVPLLFEAGWQAWVDVTVVVKTNRRVQLARLKRKRHMSAQDARYRIQAQMPLRRKIAMADFVIDNNGSLNETRKQVLHIWRTIIIRDRHIGSS